MMEPCAANSALTRIMMVEDEPDIQTILRIALEVIAGYTVEVCSCGQEALEKAPPFNPQLMLLDVMMPGMDGPATLRAMRLVPELVSIPVIFVTAKALEQEIPKYRDLGVLGVIVKPFDPMTLGQQVHALWQQQKG